MALPDYLEDKVKDYVTNVTATTSAPIDTSKFTGRAFVAGEDPLQTDAINRAMAGIGSYQPYLDSAKTLMGPGAGTGVGSVASYMSPYQQNVIDETLRQYDQSRAGGMQQISDQAFTQGAFGGGRQGAMQGQYMADTTMGRAGIVAQLQQQAFADANARRSQDFANQFRASDFERAGRAADVATGGNMGAFRMGIEDARLRADADAARTAAYEPYNRLDVYGRAITGIAGGVAGDAYAPPASPSPFGTALSTAAGVAGLFGKLYG